MTISLMTEQLSIGPTMPSIAYGYGEECRYGEMADTVASKATA